LQCFSLIDFKAFPNGSKSHFYYITDGENKTPTGEINHTMSPSRPVPKSGMGHGISESRTSSPSQNKSSSTKESKKYFKKPNFTPSVANNFWIK